MASNLEIGSIDSFYIFKIFQVKLLSNQEHIFNYTLIKGTLDLFAFSPLRICVLDNIC